MRKYNLWGCGYMGSKCRLADRIIAMMPKARHFYDLCAGGSSMSHAALCKRKFQYIHTNDINPLCVGMFSDAVDGKFANESRWISREDFFALKSTDAYAAACFSFGSDFQTYAYGKDIEEMKKAVHYALYFKDLTLADKVFGEGILNDILGMDSIDARYSKIREVLGDKGVLSSHTRLNRIKAIGDMHLDKSRLKTTCGSYSDVPIEEDSVLYADIPYFKTKTYADDGKHFDHEKFYEWALSQKSPLYISSYDMPEKDFKVVAEFARQDTMSATSVKLVAERVFMPRTQETKGNIQLSLF